MNDLLDQADVFLRAGGVWGWILAVLIALVLTSVVKLVLNVVSARIRSLSMKTRNKLDDTIADCLVATKAWVVFIWFLSPLSHLVDSKGGTQRAVQIVVVVATVIQVGIWGFCAIRNWRENFLLRRAAEDASSAAAIGLLYTTFQGLFAVVLVLVGLSNLGVDIAALLAGLGVGGIAVALAAQNILGDLLASLSIVLDKPFVVGDFIVVGNDMGTIEHIGLKTTRVRSLSGEELVFSNKDLLESRIRNFKRMWQRRVVQKFGVTYSTPAEKLEKIPSWVKEFVERYPTLKFDRCHFAGYGSSSLDFELVFWVTDPDYNLYMDYQQKLLLDILRKFAAEEIEFAFPTQTLYVEKLPQFEIQSSGPAGEESIAEA